MIFSLILAVSCSISYPPAGYQLIATQESPKHTFRIETYDKETERGSGFGYYHSVWIVASDGSKAEWLTGPDELSESYPLNISISPDEHWIMREQKLYHGANAASLYEHISGLHYREIGPPIFTRQASQFMSQQSHCRSVTNCDLVYRISSWPVTDSCAHQIDMDGTGTMTTVETPNDNSLFISMVGGGRQIIVNDWSCYYNLEKHSFYLNSTLKQQNISRLHHESTK